MRSLAGKYIKFKVKLGLPITKKDHAVCNEQNIRNMREAGASVGKGTIFYDISPKVDMQRPWMISIGEYCKITAGVIILQHDYSRSVLRRAYGPIVGEAKKTMIGNNVFIGMNSIILMGSQIGNNVIIGAGSVVSGHIPDGVVAAGNPAKVIRTLDEHYDRRLRSSAEEARNCVREYYSAYKRMPSIKEMESFFPVFLQRDRRLLDKYNILTELGGDNEEEVIRDWMATEPLYENYEEFLKSCILKKDIQE